MERGCESCSGWRFGACSGWSLLAALVFGLTIAASANVSSDKPACKALRADSDLSPKVAALVEVVCRHVEAGAEASR